MLSPYYVSTVVQQQREREMVAAHVASLAKRLRECCRPSRFARLATLSRHL